MTATARERERMANQLLMRGHATIDQIMEANFGEWPPKGLDIIGHNNQNVILTSLFDGNKETSLLKRAWNTVYEGLTTFGNATLGGPRVIRINSLLCKMLPAPLGNGMNSTLGHEATHILQGDHYWRAKTIFQENDAHEIWGKQQDALSNTIAATVFDNHMKGGMLRNAFNAVAKYVYDDIDYQKEGIEIQARMHEIMMTGYPAWGRLPGSRAELLTAMADAGLKMPESIQRELDATPGIEDIRATFTGARNHGSLPSGLTFALGNLTDEGVTKFWNQTMPALYSDLIEMYGDGPGRARFGFGVNDRAAYRERSDFLRQPAMAVNAASV